MLNRQLGRARVDQVLMRKLLRTTKFLSESQQFLLAMSLLESVESIYPLFPLVMRTIKEVLGVVDREQRKEILSEVRLILARNSFVIQVPVNKIHAVRLLAMDDSLQAGQILNTAYREAESHALRRDIILVNAARNETAWLKSIRAKYQVLSPWERTAIALASFFMGEEGSHWRKSNSKNFDSTTSALMKWVGDKHPASKGWVLPL